MNRSTRNTITVHTCEAYQGYLIHWSAFTIARNGQQRYWIEKDSYLIGWAPSIDEAKRTIRELVS